MIELQFHPRDLRGRVRHLAVGRRPLIAALLAGTLLLVFLLGSMAMAPTVIRRAYRTNHLRMMQQEQAVQSQRLREHVSQMGALEKLIDEQSLRIEKLITVYGLESEVGSGGAFRTTGEGEGELGDARRREETLRAALGRLEAQIQALSKFETEHSAAIRQTPAILPIPADQFVVTHPYGWRISPFTRTSDYHAGLDLSAPVGTPIQAAADGIVTFAGRYPMRGSIFWWRFGNLVAIKHGERFVTMYAHCDELNVRAGQTVRQGEVIATVGNSGWSTNAHLHYEVRALERGSLRPVDPQIYILNYQWNNEASLLERKKEGEKDASWEPLPSALLGGGKRRG